MTVNVVPDSEIDLSVPLTAGSPHTTVTTIAEPGAPPALKAPRRRRLPREKDWPGWALIAVQTGILAAILGFWQLGAQSGLIDAFFWSKPSAIFAMLQVFLIDGDAAIDTWYTLRATLIGFALGTSAGAAIGLSFWWSRNYAAIVQPFIVCFESIPKLALAPLIILVFGIGLASKIAIGTALTVVVTVLTTYAGVKAVDSDNERLLYSLGASRWQVFTKLVVPSALPWCISVLRINIGLALTGSIVGEFISSQHGLGRQILYAGQTYEIALVWVAVMVLSALSIIMYVAVSKLETALLKGVKR